MTVRDNNPFAASHQGYRALGWTNTLPLPAASKTPVPVGFTGIDGTTVLAGHVAKFLADPKSSNIALRLPKLVIGLDIDQYGSKTGLDEIQALELELGRLPETYVSTSRPGTGSGIRLFRLPNTVDPLKLPGNATKSTEVIRFSHRYIVVAPSIHPDDRPYVWLNPAGDLVEAPCGPGALPELPDAWVTYLLGKSAPPVAVRGDVAGHTGSAWDRIRVHVSALAETPQGPGSQACFDKGRMIGELAAGNGIEFEAVQPVAFSALDSWTFEGKGREVMEFELTKGIRKGFGKPVAWSETKSDVFTPSWATEEEMIEAKSVVAQSLKADDQVWPSRPTEVADLIAAKLERPVQFWQGSFYEWMGTHWEAIPEANIRADVYALLRLAKTRVLKGEEWTLVPWNPTSMKVSSVIDALKHRPGTYRKAPEDRVVAVKNGVFDMETRVLLEHDVNRFNLYSLPFDYDENAMCPGWMKFLSEVQPNTDEQELLQEWFGYVLSGRTDYQKILCIKGPRRSGKGTLARVLGMLLGDQSIASTSLKQLTSDFGLASLIGKSLATIPDARWSVREAGVALEKMKSISGEDVQSIGRKYLGDWTGTLGCRFMIMSNDAPGYKDASGAFTSRLLFIKMTRSFLGKEDPDLTDKLAVELPGIFNWALEGYDRLVARGYFVQPESGKVVMKEAERQESCVAGFIADVCIEDPNSAIPIKLFTNAIKVWASGEGIEDPNVSHVRQDLDARGIEVKRVGNGHTGKTTCVIGLAPAWTGAWDAPVSNIFTDALMKS